ncbi:glycoside hydrolase family 79 protein [Paxillus rubicundulus Ve08.2h10]|uniref:Glycoside hydrolase family 79 protein n=1 Tax=Paxillus rubicundulus Ve08.2h10 TaxID=930991 RepID=A0A0D0E6D3_9AGAM|nr:glycoside hydrolase family 79 protein [Paxillus rubicundulus Ve08.2h10]
MTPSTFRRFCRSLVRRSLERLTAPGAGIKYGNLTTWAGQNFASGVADGEVVEEKITTGQVDVAASSAILIACFQRVP